ncbi:hypothetical protein, partial [Salmonella sp. S146_54837]|uniref:hypothetical protein n=1 Tax=Salmonella sp. S146_54837 TaxID=2665635 RepID=UPI00165912BB
MAKNNNIHFSTGQFWAITFLVLTICLFVGLLCGLVPECEPVEDQNLSARDVAQDRQRRATFPYEELRLPAGIKPIQYRLVLDPDLKNDTNNFTGSVEIDIIVMEATEYPRVHIKEMTILSAAITKNDGTDIP